MRWASSSVLCSRSSACRSVSRSGEPVAVMAFLSEYTRWGRNAIFPLDRGPSACSLARRAHGVLDEQRKATGEEDRRAPRLADGKLAQDERGKRDPRQDAEREAHVLDEQPGDLPGGDGEPFHPALSRRASRAPAHAAARDSTPLPCIRRPPHGTPKP